MAKRILVTGAGGPAAVAFMRSFSPEECTFFAVDMTPDAAGLYLVPCERRALVPAGLRPDFIPRLLDFCRANEIDVLVPTRDTELLPIAQSRALFEKNHTAVAAASMATFNMCLDKARLMQACDMLGCTPKWSVFDGAFDVASWNFPLVIKRRSASAGRGFVVVHSPAECALIPRSRDLLVQEYLPGDEYSVDVFARRDGLVIAVVPRLHTKVDADIPVTGCTVHDVQLEAEAVAVANAIGLTGIANIQFRRDASGKPRLVEVNPRLPGTLRLTVAAGVDMPRMLLDSAIGVEQSGEMRPFRDVAMVRTWQEHFMPTDELGRMGAPEAPKSAPRLSTKLRCVG